METNFLAPAARGPSLAFYFGFQGYLFFQWASGTRVLSGVKPKQVVVDLHVIGMEESSTGSGHY